MSNDPFKWRTDSIRKDLESLESMMAAERAKSERLTAAVEGERGIKPIARYSHVGTFRADRHATVDEAGPVKASKYLPIHRDPPQFGQGVLSVA